MLKAGSRTVIVLFPRGATLFQFFRYVGHRQVLRLFPCLAGMDYACLSLWLCGQRQRRILRLSIDLKSSTNPTRSSVQDRDRVNRHPSSLGRVAVRGQGRVRDFLQLRLCLHQ